ncbi:hypothetical protein [Mycoplana dimorpha]|uniref:Response regulatory domain-containing protein n=1 Tax=Mycoplana dimorpha TaxID=28320 RepID=A0A2T5BEJ3_MYCDI|nr:hypothetical protein [Mycoplana dimorpha]PTM97401.1 hypothetical protein C7449_102273 [Mycoplana dimorpha]
MDIGVWQCPDRIVASTPTPIHCEPLGMNKVLPHVGIVEQEYLIAVDAEFLIRQALDCRVSLIRPDQFDRWTDTDLSTLDICLLDVPFDPTQAIASGQRLRRLGRPILFTTVSEFHRRGIETFDGVPVVMKPYDGDKLLGAVQRVLPAFPHRQN